MVNDAYPLTWPAMWPRTAHPQISRFSTSLASARNGLISELELLGASNIVISSNATLLKSGLLAARQSRIDDPGAVAYFTFDGEERAIPCDKWTRLEDNLRAIELTVAALRGLERWGAKEMVAAAFRGFAALPSGTGAAGWWDALGVDRNADSATIDAAYRAKARQLHPDVGGDAEAFHQLTEAYRQAKGAQP